MIQIQQLAKAWQLSEEDERPNPVTQRVKIIMVCFVVMSLNACLSFPNSTWLVTSRLDTFDISLPGSSPGAASTVIKPQVRLTGFSYYVGAR